MKMKMFVLAIGLLLVVSGMLVAVEGRAIEGEGEERVSEEIEDTELQSAHEINDWHDLGNIRIEEEEDDDYIGGLDGDYVLMNDLDENTDGYDELVDTEDGWEPIGGPFSPPSYTGEFDGNGYEISDLYID